MDVVTPEKRSEIMSKVRGKDTGPEMKVRRLVHGMGYRYRLHVGKLPGRPDLVFPARRKVIFVNGCFWHGHRRCKLGRIPKSRIEFWTSKIEYNKRRDSKNIRKISSHGWRSLTVWECQLRNIESLRTRIEAFLG